MFQYNDKSVFSGIESWIKIVAAFGIIVLAFVSNNPKILLALFITEFLLLMIAGYGFRNYVKLTSMLLPFIIITTAVFWFFFRQDFDVIPMLIRVFLRMLCIFYVFALFTFTTDLFGIVTLLKKLKFPKIIWLSLYITLRFLPELERDYHSIKEIQKIRGLTMKKGLIKHLAAHFIPLILLIITKAEELSIAFYLKEKETEAFK